MTNNTTTTTHQDLTNNKRCFSGRYPDGSCPDACSCMLIDYHQSHPCLSFCTSDTCRADRMAAFTACTHEGGTDWVAIQMPHNSREGILEICQDCDAASKTHEMDCAYIGSLSESVCDCDAEWTS